MHVCAECGSKVNYRSEETTTVEDQVRQFQKVPFNCSNNACLNANPSHHDFEWCKAL